MKGREGGKREREGGQELECRVLSLFSYFRPSAYSSKKVTVTEATNLLFFNLHQ